MYRKYTALKDHDFSRGWITLEGILYDVFTVTAFTKGMTKDSSLMKQIANERKITTFSTKVELGVCQQLRN